MSIDNKSTSGANAPDVKSLENQNAELIKINDKLAKDLEKKTKENESLKEKVADLKVKLSENKAAKKTSSNDSGIPAVVKFNGVKYTREEILNNSKLLSDLKKLGFVKSQKK